MTAALWSEVTRLAETGDLRRVSGAFARFVGSLGAATPAVLLAALVLSEMEGQGHSCLPLADLAAGPGELLGWPDGQWSALAAAAGPLPKNARAWRAELAACELVYQAGEFDYGQPLVLDGDRLYLRRYWRDEKAVADAIRARALAAREVDAPAVRQWLDLLVASHRAAEQPDWQKLACAIALRGSVAVITGGPGTGKTYTVARLLALLFAMAGEEAGSRRIALAAPTGKAAARLKQSIDKALVDLAQRVGDALPLRRLAER
ncbi:MAG TPA: AAA family ATPase, partial [Ramlibacter sp.]